ncbi:MAG: VanZ family protein [Chitinophagaceae bacterium]
MTESTVNTTNRMIIKILLWIAFIAYMLLLCKYILFTRMHTEAANYFSPAHIHASIQKGMHKANLTPFKTIQLMWHGRVSTDTQYKNLGGNLIGFVPMGILLPLLFKKLRTVFIVVLVVLLVSLGYELVQLCTGLGVFDVDDLILNTAGGLIGCIVHFCAMLIYRQPRTAST